MTLTVAYGITLCALTFTVAILAMAPMVAMVLIHAREEEVAPALVYSLGIFLLGLCESAALYFIATSFFL